MADSLTEAGAVLPRLVVRAQADGDDGRPLGTYEFLEDVELTIAGRASAQTERMYRGESFEGLFEGLYDPHTHGPYGQQIREQQLRQVSKR